MKPTHINDPFNAVSMMAALRMCLGGYLLKFIFPCPFLTPWFAPGASTFPERMLDRDEVLPLSESGIEGSGVCVFDRGFGFATLILGERAYG